MSCLLGLAPPLLLTLLLLFGIYPGEEIIARIGRRAQPPARTTQASPKPPWTRLAAGIGERLLLLAGSRPLRGPPLLSPARDR